MKKLIARVDSFYKRLPSHTNWKLWFVVALFIKSIFFTFKIVESQAANSDYPKVFAKISGDAVTYIEPIENLIANGDYHDDYRMPGYGWVYYILRLFLAPSTALNGLAILQLLLSAFSVYVLALAALQVFNHQRYFYTAFFLYAISTFVSLFDHYILTESFCTSSLIIAFYFVLQSSSRKINLLWAGLFITWAIFLKPVMAVFMIIFGWYVLIRNSNGLLKLRAYAWKGFTLFILPFFVLDGIWMIRNYNKYHRVFPLTKTVFVPGTEESYYGALFRFMNSFGGSIVWWKPGSEITFFKPLYQNEKTTLPSSIYTSRFNHDSLLTVREMIITIDNSTTLQQQKDSLTRIVKEKLEGYTLSIKQEKPFLFYVTSRMKVLKTLFVHTGTYNLFERSVTKLNWAGLIVKAFYSFLYAFVILCGFVGCFLLLLNFRKKTTYALLAVCGLYLAMVFPFVFGTDEFRYFVPGYPFFLMASLYTLKKMLHLFTGKQYNTQ